jgi:ATP-binding cassette subfamily B protein
MLAPCAVQLSCHLRRADAPGNPSTDLLKADLLRIIRRLAAEARHVPQTIRLVWSATAGWTSVWLVLLAIEGLLPAAAIYLTRGAVDSVLAAMSSGIGSAAIPTLIDRVMPLAIVMVGQVVVAGAIRWVRFHQSEILQAYVTRRIHEQSVAVSLRFYDFPEYFDRLHRARDEASHRPAALVEVTGGLLKNAVTSIGVAAVLLPYGWWLPAALLLGGAPSLLLVLRSSLERQEWKKRSTPAFRKLGYFDYLVTSRDAAAEIRVFDLGAGFIAAYGALRQRLVSEQSRFVRREAVGELAAALLGMAVAAVAGAWVLWQAVQGRLTAGSLALFFAAFVQAQRVMQSLLENAAQIYMNSLFLGDLFEFLALPPEPVRPVGAAPPIGSTRGCGLRFEHVEFTYPGASRPALCDFTVDIPAGQTVAIVGPNGAGKTTVIKLLCRFYDPDRGRIVLDGADIADWSAPEVRKLMSALFQEPVRYSASVVSNVLPEANVDEERTRVSTALHAAGADGIVERLPRGCDTLLGKWLDDGVELSGGEWQRIALARAFARDTPILLLDEPTSAMDSWAEAEWFARFRQATAGRTTILITHRFTTAMQADVIHVMDGGRIVESGSHEQLLALGGRYASSWAHQTREHRSSTFA